MPFAGWALDAVLEQRIAAGTKWRIRAGRACLAGALSVALMLTVAFYLWLSQDADLVMFVAGSLISALPVVVALAPVLSEPDDSAHASELDPRLTA